MKSFGYLKQITSVIYLRICPLDTIKDKLIANNIDIYREWILQSFAQPLDPLAIQSTVPPTQPGGANKRHTKKTKKRTTSL